MKSIAAADANRQFSSLLREVAGGVSVTILSHGKPVAVLSPADADALERETARSRLLTRLRGQAVTGARDWTRDELYEEKR